MSNIRKEYSEYKHFKQQIFTEASEAWTEENVILINERLNRNAIYRLNSAIERFDKKFGPYRDKLPAIANILSNAENGLHLVITGKVGSRTTAQMLQRMSIMYNILSNFFGGDLAALLKTPAFRVAHEQPDEKIDKIADRGHDVKAIRRTLASALKPNDEERTIFRRAFKSFEMPTLDWNMAAKQLCCLSCNELKDLTEVQKVPMVVVDTEEPKENNDVGDGVMEVGAAAGVANAYNAIQSGVSRGANTGAKYGIPLAGAAVGLGVTAAGAGIQGIFNRFKSRSKEMTASIDKLQKYVNGVEGFENISTALTQMREKSKAAANATFDINGGIRGLLKHPSVIIMKQAVMASEAIEAVVKAWNEHIKTTYQNGINQADLPKIKKELEKRIKGSAFSRIKGAISGVKPFPGLSPDDIIKAVMNVASKDVVSQGISEILPEAANKKDVQNKMLEMHQFISEFMLTENYNDLSKLVQQIGTFEKTKEGNAETNVEKDIETVTKTGNIPGTSTKTSTTQQPTKTKSAEPTNVQRPTNAAEAPKAAQNIAREADAAAQQDPNIDTTDMTSLNASIVNLDKNLSDPLNGELLKNINTQIAALKVPGITDYNTAAKFIEQYITILNSETLTNIRRAMSMTLNTIEQNLQNQTRPIQENSLVKRKIVVEKIKKIIIEQMAEADVTQITPQPIVRVDNPSTAPTTQTAPVQSPVSNIQIVDADEGELPVIDDTVIKNYVSKINDLNKYPLTLTKQILAAISNQLKTYNIPGVNDLQTFTNFMTTYQSIMTNAGNIRKILSMINKTAAVFNKPAPAAAPAPAAPATPA